MDPKNCEPNKKWKMPGCATGTCKCFPDGKGSECVGCQSPVTILQVCEPNKDFKKEGCQKCTCSPDGKGFECEACGRGMHCYKEKCVRDREGRQGWRWRRRWLRSTSGSTFDWLMLLCSENICCKAFRPAFDGTGFEFKLPKQISNQLHFDE